MMLVGLAALLATLMASREGTARAQTVWSDIVEIPVHSDVPTIIHLPDGIVVARVTPKNSIRMVVLGRTLIVRPFPEVPVGKKAWLEVDTATKDLTFRLRVVENPKGAREQLLVVAWPKKRTAKPGPPSGARPRPLELSAHAIGGLGFSGFEIAGHAARNAQQPHGSIGVQLMSKRPDAWWAPVATISAEWPIGTMEYEPRSEGQPLLAVSGPLLRAELAMSARFGRTLSPYASAGIGMQVHLRRTAGSSAGEAPEFPVREMKPGPVLVLAMGLQYRAGAFLFGFELQQRYGGPDGYSAVEALGTVGRFLDLGE